jgi:L,D-peptidoglycan transpeptidase YkuD (ErfK/YbiS/YcfS/YnhG family)
LIFLEGAKSMRGLSGSTVMLCVLLSFSSAFGQACPALMHAASRLIVVTAPTLTSSAGTLRLFERRRSDAAWTVVGAAEPVTLGSKGVAWGRAFRYLASDHEPIKVEGDKRSPAGIYPIGRPFGFAYSQLAGYLRLRPDSVCVEDPLSPAYNTITSENALGQSVGAQNMGAISQFRRGLIIDYPTDAANRAGSCIFIHVRKNGPTGGTAGCLNLSENRVAALQSFANKHPSVLVLIPESALDRLRDCLPYIAGEIH